MSLFSLFKKQRSSIAFSFDNHTIRWVAVARDKSGIVVETYGSEMVGPSVMDGFDQIVDDAQFVDHLKRIKSNIAETIELREVNVVIPDHAAICFHTHIAKEPPKHMNDVIVDHLKTYCQSHDLLHFDKYICEYDVILETEFGYDAHVTLVPQDYVNHLVRLFKQSGIIVKHIETAHHAVARSCMNIPQGQGYIAVAFGKTKTHVSLVHGNHLVSHNVLPIGIETLHAAIVKILRNDVGDAQKILDKYGLLHIHPDDRVLGALYQTLAPIVLDINKQIIDQGTQPYKTFGERFTTNHLVVYGQGVGIKGLVDWLGTQTSLSARPLDVWAGRSDKRAPIIHLPAGEALWYAEVLSLALVYLD